jgi:hypothetical protein
MTTTTRVLAMRALGAVCLLAGCRSDVREDDAIATAASQQALFATNIFLDGNALATNATLKLAVTGPGYSASVIRAGQLPPIGANGTYTNKLIAFELDLSEAAISNAVRAAAAKLGARTRVELARMLASVPESLDD